MLMPARAQVWRVVSVNKEVSHSMILRRIATAGLIFLCVLPISAEMLPRPAGLEPEIAFWRKVFAEVTSGQALIHDNRHLGVIYEVVAIPANASSRQRKRVADRARKQYKSVLNTLADGRRSSLSAEQQRVLELWPDDVTNDELRAAASRIRFQQGLSDRFRKGLIRSGKWEDHIREQLADAGVPAGVASLPHVESSYNPDARSHVGAAGLWQFTRQTGRRFMQIDHVVDERRDPYASSAAAASLLQYNYSILKSWPLAITAYNHGVAGMRRAVRTTGSEDIEVIIREYNGRAFGFASRNFYVALLAADEVVENSEKYVGVIEKDAPVPQIVIPMTDYVSVASLERVLNVSLATLKANNPALLASVWNGTKHVPRGFELRIPAAAIDRAAHQLLAAIPQNERFARQTPDLQHRVERGDSLSVIAARYNTTVSELVAMNQLRSKHRIRAGQVLNLPYKGPVSLASIPGEAETYIVRSGDTLSRIAQRAGVRESELLALNAMPGGDRIYPGQEIVLRVVTPAVPTAVTAAAPADAPVLPPAGRRPPDTDEPAELEPVVIADAGIQPAVILDADSESAQADVDSALLADPSDYLVAADDTIEIQAAETLGHYADWLGIKTQRLRDLNGYSFRQPVVIGRRLRLEFAAVDRDAFVALRIGYHRELQETFFARHRIVATTVHKLRSGESLYVLSLQRYKVPVWLLRQYNPDLNIDRLQPGTPITFPKIQRTAADDGAAAVVHADFYRDWG